MELNNLLNKEKEIMKLTKINSKYILKIVFNNLIKKKWLDIIKYNKSIKNIIDINVNHYKEYSEKYSSIEIEIKPFNNQYGKYINFG